jgi:hypothetical protein
MSELITIAFNSLPEIFHQSRVYKSRNQLKNHEEILLLNNVCNFKLQINNYTELCYALETLRYWNFEKTPECFYNMILAKKTIIREIILQNEYDLIMRFQTFKTFAEMCVLTVANANELILIAADLKLINLIEYISR